MFFERIAQDGEIDVVTRDGRPMFMALPMGANLDSRRVRLELAVSLFDRDRVSIGVASGIAGLSIRRHAAIRSRCQADSRFPHACGDEPAEGMARASYVLRRYRRIIPLSRLNEGDP